jgi:hypothetical protein
VTVDGQPVAVSVTKDGFIEWQRTWTAARVKASFPKHIQVEPLPGDPRRCALVDGPVVLAAVVTRRIRNFRHRTPSRGNMSTSTWKAAIGRPGTTSPPLASAPSS